MHKYFTLTILTKEKMIHLLEFYINFELNSLTKTRE